MSAQDTGTFQVRGIAAAGPIAAMMFAVGQPPVEDGFDAYEEFIQSGVAAGMLQTYGETFGSRATAIARGDAVIAEAKDKGWVILGQMVVNLDGDKPVESYTWNLSNKSDPLDGLFA